MSTEHAPAAIEAGPAFFQAGDIVRSIDPGRRGRWYVDAVRAYADGGCMILIDDFWVEADSYEKVTYGPPE
jgi:hypothetical protein